ncbi:hypothetical protein PALB_5730 [Pseudoalteromonas luteoviolacea B = ATCC 29581]|nr:hypothetical protein PALB_5730 [Pseudoalteromonas luteoviolacea B = ATCC 29581]
MRQFTADKPVFFTICIQSNNCARCIPKLPQDAGQREFIGG